MSYFVDVESGPGIRTSSLLPTPFRCVSMATLLEIIEWNLALFHPLYK